MAKDLRQTEGWARYLRSLGWEVEELRSKNSKLGTKIYIREIPLLGSVVKIQRPEVIPPVKEIDELARRRRALFVKLEPLAISPKPGRDQEIASPSEGGIAGFVLDRTPNLPTKTIVVDLTKSEEELWKNLSQDTRQRVRKAKSEGLKVRVFQPGGRGFEKALQDFHALLQESGRRGGFWTPSLGEMETKARAFGKGTLLFLINDLAGALVLVNSDLASYQHAGSSKKGQELSAPYFLLWEIIRFLKNPKPHPLTPSRYLDLEGIADERFSQTKRWEGFSVFKRKWGGKEIEYPLPRIKFYSRPLGLLFRFDFLVQSWFNKH